MAQWTPHRTLVVRGCVLLEVRLPIDNIFCVGEGGVQSTLFCIFTHCYFISCPNKLKICHTMKQLYINNIMAKRENNALQKKFYNQFKKGTFLSSVPHAWYTLDMSMRCTSPVNKKLGCMHCIIITWYPMENTHLLTAFLLFSHSNYLLSLHGKTNFLWLTNIKWNQCSMLKFMLYHTNIMCL